jgi:hypothetical protein
VRCIGNKHIQRWLLSVEKIAVIAPIVVYPPVSGLQKHAQAKHPMRHQGQFTNTLHHSATLAGMFRIQSP